MKSEPAPRPVPEVNPPGPQPAEMPVTPITPPPAVTPAPIDPVPVPPAPITPEPRLDSANPALILKPGFVYRVPALPPARQSLRVDVRRVASEQR